MPEYQNSKTNHIYLLAHCKSLSSDTNVMKVGIAKETWRIGESEEREEKNMAV